MRIKSEIRQCRLFFILLISVIISFILEPSGLQSNASRVLILKIVYISICEASTCQMNIAIIMLLIFVR
jgi:hypothetical protein